MSRYTLKRPTHVVKRCGMRGVCWGWNHRQSITQLLCHFHPHGLGIAETAHPRQLHHFDDVRLSPRPPDGGPPLWVGGNTPGGLVSTGEGERAPTPGHRGTEVEYVVSDSDESNPAHCRRRTMVDIVDDDNTPYWPSRAY